MQQLLHVVEMFSLLLHDSWYLCPTVLAISDPLKLSAVESMATLIFLYLVLITFLNYVDAISSE